MSENEAMEVMDDMPDNPDYDPDYWDRKRKEEWAAKLAPYKAMREQINEHDELMADALYEITLLALGIEEV